MRIILLFLPLFSLFLVSCDSSDSGTEEAAATNLLTDPHDDGNSFACTTCHALQEPTTDGYIRPGHPIGDAAQRPSFKNGKVATLLEAVNSCRTEWMAAPAFTAEDSRWLSLKSRLAEAAGTAVAQPLTFEIVQPPAELGSGDAAAGKVIFNKTCIVCHGQDAAGSDRGPALAGTTLSAAKIAERIRLSGTETSPVYDGLTGGRMPFWAKDRLSDKELVDMVAFLLGSEAITKAKEPVSANISDTGATGSCGSSHSRVGKTATFRTLQHGVQGDVTIVDDCTLRISNFHYDGGGIEVRIFGAKSRDFINGISLSKDIFGTAFTGQTVDLKLPASTTLDSFDSVSVWCVKAKQNFGDAQF